MITRWLAERRQRRRVFEARREQWAHEAHEKVMAGGDEGRETARDMNIGTNIEGKVVLGMVVLVGAVLAFGVPLAILKAATS